MPFPGLKVPSVLLRPLCLKVSRAGLLAKAGSLPPTVTIAPPTSLAMLLSASLRSEAAATDVDIRPDPVDGAKAAADAMAAAKITDFMVVLLWGVWDCLK